MKKTANKTAWNKSLFISAIIPIQHTERDIRFSGSDTVVALALIFGTIALMRFILVR